MSDLIKVASLDDFDPPEEGLFVEVGGVQIALFLVDGVIYAVEEKCPHRGGPLSEGVVTGGEVRCPWHGARFDLKRGTVRCDPAKRDIKTYEANIVEGDVFVRL